MNFEQEEIDFMMKDYDIMADADGKRGVNAWAKISVKVGLRHIVSVGVV